MSRHVAYFLTAFAVFFTCDIILFPVEGQLVVQGGDIGNSSSNISCTAEMQKMFLEAIRQLNAKLQGLEDQQNASFKQLRDQQVIAFSSIQSVDRRSQSQIEKLQELLNSSLEELKNRQDTVMTSVLAIDNRTKDHDYYIRLIQNNQVLLNASYLEMINLDGSFEKMKIQQGVLMIDLQAVDKRTKEHDYYIRQIESNHVLLNASFKEMINLNVSFEKMKNQQDALKINLQEVDKRSKEQVQSIHEYLNVSFEQMKTQQERVMTNLQAVDRHTQVQVESMGEFFNASFQQLKQQQQNALTSLQMVDRRSKDQVQDITEFLNSSHRQIKEQQDITFTSLQTVERRSQEHGTYIKQLQHIREFLNASNEQIGALNASLVQINNQQDAALLRLLAFDRRSLEQDVYIKQVKEVYNFLNESFHLMRYHQDSSMTTLQTIDLRSKEQDVFIKLVQNVHLLLNVTSQQMKTQQDSALTSLQAVERMTQEHDVYIKQMPGINEFLHASFQQITTQQDVVRTSLESFDRRLDGHDTSTKNQIQNAWKLATMAIPVQAEIGMDLGEGPVLLPAMNNWIILMHRSDGSVNFNRNWADYRNGFGDIGRGEFWLGNEKVHRLTSKVGVVYTLRVEVYIKQTWYIADYTTFSLDSEHVKYALRVSGYSGTAGDSLTNRTVPATLFHGGMPFSTQDADNDASPTKSCAVQYEAGWWFNNCFQSCLTCAYNTEFRWGSLTQLTSDGLLKAARMMIKSI